MIGFLPLFVLGMELYKTQVPRFVGIAGGLFSLVLMVEPSAVSPVPYPDQMSLALLDRLLIGAGLGLFA